MPSFSDDEVLDFLVTEAIHRRVIKARKKAADNEERGRRLKEGGKDLLAQMKGQI